ncbi:MAG: flagellin [Myxococcota bacterium]|nr:flagellin [Myxococcota bacterium]
MSALSIRTFAGSNRSLTSMRRSGGRQQAAVQRLSSGLRVQKASDGSAALAMGQTMSAQLRGLQQARRNANDGVNMLQGAEGAYQSISSTISRLQELAVEAANDSLSDVERGMLDTEYQELLVEIERITDVQEWNGILTVDPQDTFLTFQVGTRNSANDIIRYEIKDQNPGFLGISGTSIDTRANAQTAVGNLEGASNNLHEDRAALGSTLNKLRTAIANLDSSVEDYASSIGKVRDADMGRQSAEFTRQQVLQQAGVAMLAQGNASPSVALKLLG